MGHLDVLFGPRGIFASEALGPSSCEPWVVSDRDEPTTKHAEMRGDRPDWLTAENEADIMRVLADRVTHVLRHNRYGNMAPYLAHSLEVISDADPQAVTERLIAGATIEELLAEHGPISDAGIGALRAEVQDLKVRLAAAPDPPEQATAVVHMAETVLKRIESCLQN
jgi:hypothetical protein